MFSLFVPILLLINLIVALDNNTIIETAIKTTHTYTDQILCRSCGAVVSSSNYIFSKESPSSQYAFEDTLFSRKAVLVQVFQSDILFNFAVITAEHSTCLSIGEWETSELWFPRYRWKPCVCPECGDYVGWVFEPIEHNLFIPNIQFFGLILTNLIGESCKYDFA